MIFNSIEFILFFAAVYCVYRLLNFKAQNIFLLAASYFFYGCWDWRFLFLLFASTVIDYYCGSKIHDAPSSKEKRSWLLLSLSANLGILGFFKYFNFFAGNLYALFSLWGIHLDDVTLNIILPVGVSFYTFQSISYIVDIYFKKIKPENNFFDYALFVSFFPQLVAGPIERAAHMLPQYKAPREITAIKNKEGAWFIYWGFFLKIFVADNMAQAAALVFNQTGELPGIEVVLGTYAFAFQVFGDFAGYSFIAIGAARLLGFDLMVNFLFPYFVTNPADFWKHWHVSLSSWLRDYLYIPLGGNRKGELKTYRNLLITMFLGGLWHGAAWTYGIWGIYQGMTLSIHRFFKSFFPKTTNHAVDPWFIHILKVILMFQVTCFGWLIFRANSLEQLKVLLHSLVFNWSAPSDKAIYLAAEIVFYSAFFLFVQVIQKHQKNLLAIADQRGFIPWVFYIVMFYLIMLFGEFGGKEFIYFRF